MNARKFLNFFICRSQVQVHLTTVAILLAVLACVTTPVSAQDSYPNRPVKLIVAFPPGGAVDGIGREVAKDLSLLWGQPVVVENKPGAGGVIAADTTAKAAPDGYTLFLATGGIATVVPFIQNKLPYDPLADIKPIALIGSFPLILVTTPSFNTKNLAEFVAAAKAKPGMIHYASNGVGVSPHMAMELFQRTAGIKLNHIPYKGSGPAMQDMLGGRVPVMWAAVSSALPHIQSGKLIPLVVGSLERLSLLPQVPTVSESGFPGFEAAEWIGMMGPGNMPEALVRKIQTDLQKVTSNAAYREQQVARGNQVRASTTDEFAKRIRAEYNRNKELFASGEIRRE
jgi:tripartite-type tricarboxylate transporter receptor subunit TctC